MRVQLFVFVLVGACGPTTPDGSNATTGDVPSSMTTDEASVTVEATTTVTSTTPTTSGAAESTGDASESTGASEIQEWIGAYTTGFGYAYFSPCEALDDNWIAMGIPGFELCEAAPLWLHVRGTVAPGEFGPELTVMEVIAGPCRAGTCAGDGSPSNCGSFDELCL